MSFPVLTRDALQKASRKNDLIIETGYQIQKDFGEFGLEVKFSGNASSFYEELFDQMKDHVEQLMAESMERFMHFLYRIDISQHNIAQYEKEMEEDDIHVVLTELIIHRELKKVITRDYFRQQTKDIDQNELDL